MSSKFSVAILGGIGAGKKSLAHKLSRQLTPFQNAKIYFVPEKFIDKAQGYGYKVFIDYPFDKLLEKYVLSLPLRELIDKQNLQKKLAEFRSYHLKNVVPAKLEADFLIQDLENEERIHYLSLKVLEQWRSSLNPQLSEEESPEVQVYLDRRIHKAHPQKITNRFDIH